ncbi:hypothetical protein C0Q70_20369 [Pomacea canaliculata]|uniref:Uncharacterized protein n=1 Tax=Pomacea canaliculata TaxID=400727 RepID=A0A2T7NFE2_POMCA|nr:hypothetical protein C0Q70_20369 [Pomacea canaliculata]
MAGEDSGEGITVSVNVSSTADQDYSHLPVYDFHKMVALDWDKVYDGPMNQLLYTSWNGLNIGRLTLAIWILASHLALILFVLGKAKLREQPKNILIINLSLANILLRGLPRPH